MAGGRNQVAVFIINGFAADEGVPVGALENQLDISLLAGFQHLEGTGLGNVLFFHITHVQTQDLLPFQPR